MERGKGVEGSQRRLPRRQRGGARVAKDGCREDEEGMELRWHRNRRNGETMGLALVADDSISLDEETG